MEGKEGKEERQENGAGGQEAEEGAKMGNDGNTEEKGRRREGRRIRKEKVNAIGKRPPCRLGGRAAPERRRRRGDGTRDKAQGVQLPLFRRPGPQGTPKLAHPEATVRSPEHWGGADSVWDAG